MKKSTLYSDREKIVNYLHNKLIGPSNGENERLLKNNSPNIFYMMGALFPQGASGSTEDDDQDIDYEDSINMAYQIKPSSLGLSFFLEGQKRDASIIVELSAAEYKLLKDDTDDVISEWIRKPIATKTSPETYKITKGSGQNVKGVLNGNANLFSNWREVSGGYLVTVTLINQNKIKDKLNPEDCLYQVWFRCSSESSKISAYPAIHKYSWDEEEEELSLIYENKKTFAIGHGCSPVWAVKSGQEFVSSVETSFIPTYEVPPITADLPRESKIQNSDVFSLQYLADESISWSDKREKLHEFILDYGSWVENEIGKDCHEELKSAAGRIKGRLELAVYRMHKGLDFLTKNKGSRDCFLMANKAMLIQMIHASDQFGGSLKDANSFKVVHPDYQHEDWRKFKWRPFQLAFQLLSIESVGNGNSDERDIVDLIWFPTGGGKTEAYLAVSAFELFHRRYHYGDSGGGTSVILRYTLRLLTTQQFQRAAGMICACEYLRALNTEKWGDEIFSLGLWVGNSTTPNSFNNDNESHLGSYQKYQQLIEENKPENPFQLLQCPCCGTRIVPRSKSESIDSYGIKASASSFKLFCPTETCRFNDQLPIQIVDEGLYQEPPSFLIATIDKFARLTWSDGPKAFFDGGNNKRRPPSLILQDELHLISGPLGTISGIYESAIDVLLKKNDGRPKYIAATATIRRAYDQVRSLYARDCAIFPPSGMSSEDSYFSREEELTEQNPGRLYIGIMGQYHTSTFSLVHTSAALSQSCIDLDLSEVGADGYWTQVIFHNSKRELGKTMTMAQDDIPKRAEVIANDPRQSRRIIPTEMSANIPSKEIPEILELLKAHKDSGNSIDCLPCTNMFSVGVDVKRLGLIVMHGQPKTTAEYIQASSRVGRDLVPGLVVAFYSNTKSRDRSIYENFIPYHQSIYRAVEPTSVTPSSMPALERALHAALVIVVRYGAGLSNDRGAKKFDKNNDTIKNIIEKLRGRLLATELNEDARYEISDYLDQCVDAWHMQAESAKNNGVVMKYGKGKIEPNFMNLLYEYTPGTSHKPEIPWATLNSMRNVDIECDMYIRGEDY